MQACEVIEVPLPRFLPGRASVVLVFGIQRQLELLAHRGLVVTKDGFEAPVLDFVSRLAVPNAGSNFIGFLDTMVARPTIDRVGITPVWAYRICDTLRLSAGW